MHNTQLIYILSLVVTTSCADPLNPFGNSIRDIGNANNIDSMKISPDSNDIEIQFTPKRQNLHNSHDLRILITSKSHRIEEENIRLAWNKKQVTSGIREYAQFKKVRNGVLLTIPSLKLSTLIDNELEIQYQLNDHKVSKIYSKPKCNIDEIFAIQTLNPFNVDENYKNKIEQYAIQRNINPSLVSGLIASESSFNPRAVSYAKALGLTQVTNIAHKQLQSNFPKWNIDKRTAIFPAPVVKSLVNLKKITKKNDWRLDIDKSIEGGVEYLNYLVSYWSKFETSQRITSGEKTNLILASYNFGPARIKSYFKKDRKNWLNNKRLKEAKKYTNKIKSYCDHFTNHQGISHDKKAYHF